MHILRPLLLVGLLLVQPSIRAAAPDADGPIDLHVKPSRLAEWNDWRLGLFIHWGPWSQTKIGYIWKMAEDSPAVRAQRFELWKTFDPDKFDPHKWARAAKAAGMKYVVFIAKHHDGFSNYDTQLSPFKITSPEVPFSKNQNADITRAVIDAFRAEGLAIGLYYSHIDWHHPDGKYFSSTSPEYDAGRIDRDPASWQRFADYEIGQLRELLTNYGKIDLLWFDISWPYAGSDMKPSTNKRVRASVIEMLTTIKTLQPDIIFDDRGTDIYGGFHTPEQRVPETGLPDSWETSLTITNGRGFWYKGDQVSAKTPSELVRALIDVASKGGNLLLNVGPRPDGELSPGEYAGLAGIGAWMHVNSESIYGTTRSLFLNLPWGRSTTKGDTLYLHVFDWPKDGVLLVPGLRTPVKKAWRIADPSKTALAVTVRGDDQAIAVGTHPDNEISTVIALEFAVSPSVKNTIRQPAQGSLELPAAQATIRSATARYNYGHGVSYGNFIENISSLADRISWDVSLPQSGKFHVAIEYAVQTGYAGSTFQLTFGDAPVLTAKTQATADWRGALINVRDKSGAKSGGHDNRWVFKTVDLGEVTLPAGDHTVTLVPQLIKKDYLLFLKGVTLTPSVAPQP